MSEIYPCPSCGSEDVSRNGHTRHGKQNYKCRDCGRQFVLEPQWQMLSEEQKGLINRLLLERISLAGIAALVQLSEDCVQRYVNRNAQPVVRQVEVSEKPKKRLTYRWINSGRSSMTRATSSGSDWQLMRQHEKLLASISAIVVENQQPHFGAHCRRFIVSAL